MAKRKPVSADGTTPTTSTDETETESESERLRRVQCKLNKAGAADLVIDLVICDPSHEVLFRTIELAKALLLEGNDEVQASFYKRLSKVAEKFLVVVQAKLQSAQNRLKADMLAAGDRGGRNVWQPSPASSPANPSPSRNSPLPSPKPSMTDLTNPFNNAVPNVERARSSIADMAYQRRARAHSKQRLNVTMPLFDTHDENREENNNAAVSSSAKLTPKVNRRRSNILPTPASASSTVSRTDSNNSDMFTDHDLMGVRSVSINRNRPRSLMFMQSHDMSVSSDNFDPGQDYEYEDQNPGDPSSVQSLLHPEVVICEPILRFLQLLCENHNSKLQNFLRHQNLRTNFNLVAEVLTFLDTICGSTKGSLGVFREISYERDMGNK